MRTHTTLINTYEAYEAENCGTEWNSHSFLNPRSLRSAKDIREQLGDKMLRLGLDLQSGGAHPVKRSQCLVAGYLSRGSKNAKALLHSLAG
jgi:hypothetical protein